MGETRMPQEQQSEEQQFTGGQQFSGGQRIVLLTRGNLWAFFGIAIVVAVVTLVGGTFAVVQQLASGETPLTLAAGHSLPRGTDVGSAHIVQGSYDSAAVVLSHLSPFGAALATIPSIGGTLTRAALALLVAALAWRLVGHTMFRRSLTLVTYLAGAVPVIGLALECGERLQRDAAGLV